MVSSPYRTLAIWAGLLGSALILHRFPIVAGIILVAVALVYVAPRLWKKEKRIEWVYPGVVSIGMTDKIRSQQQAAQSRLDPATEAIVDRIVQLVGGDGGFANKAALREIGEELNRQGGIDRMRLVYYRVRNKGPYFSQDIWHMIGDWRE